MINQLLPRHIDNTHRGYKLALWLFALVVSVMTLQGLSVIIDGYYVAGSAAAIRYLEVEHARGKVIIKVESNA